jgi:hypothetical protein
MTERTFTKSDMSEQVSSNDYICNCGHSNLPCPVHSRVLTERTRRETAVSDFDGVPRHSKAKLLRPFAEFPVGTIVDVIYYGASPTTGATVSPQIMLPDGRGWFSVTEGVDINHKFPERTGRGGKQ